MFPGVEDGPQATEPGAHCRRVNLITVLPWVKNGLIFLDRVLFFIFSYHFPRDLWMVKSLVLGMWPLHLCHSCQPLS